MLAPENNKNTPLAERIRPFEFSQLVGQESIFSTGSGLRTLLDRDEFFAMIFWGPPGTGKTSLALLAAKKVNRPFISMSAVRDGVKEIRKQIAYSEELKSSGQKTLLIFMDEIHRLNKAQQDVLLPALESGAIKFIGATTENPSFEVNNAVLSRCMVYRFEKLETEALVKVLKRALSEDASGLGEKQVDEKLLLAIANAADGDARRSLNILEAVIKSVPEDQTIIGTNDYKNLMSDFNSNYDKDSDYHYDTISAFIKSIRASHPDAALHYLARMIDAGEDPVFIARRIVIAASEDVGNANPMALLIATSAMQAVHMLGYPEARIVLSQAVTYLASSPKSNRSYEAIEKALADVKELGALDVPLHLRNAPTKLMRGIGYGKYYAYAHSNPEQAKESTYLPKELAQRVYYEPSNVGVEAQLADNLKHLRPRKD